MSAGTYSDLLRALGQNESGNNYAFVSSLGYLGRFQFGEEALQAIGFYQGDGNPYAIDFVGAWTETAHGYGVWDKASFLATPAAQDAAADAWFGKVWQDAAALNLQSYIGQWVAGVEVTPSGILAGAHLVGVWNLKSWLESGGAVDTRDGYGTPVSQYVGKFGGYDTPFAPAGGEGGGGSGGADTFHVFQGSGLDLVLDFNPWEGDRVDALGPYSTYQSDAGAVVDMGGDSRMVLQGVQLSSLPEGWIV